MLLRLASSIFAPLFSEYAVLITICREKGNKNRMIKSDRITEKEKREKILSCFSFFS
jgi:hypothetical protein